MNEEDEIDIVSDAAVNPPLIEPNSPLLGKSNVQVEKAIENYQNSIKVNRKRNTKLKSPKKSSRNRCQAKTKKLIPNALQHIEEIIKLDKNEDTNVDIDVDIGENYKNVSKSHVPVIRSKQIRNIQRARSFPTDGDGGCTIVHGDQGEILSTTVVKEDRKPTIKRRPAIHLIYSTPITVSYAVSLNLSALLLMDFHAHSSRSEVIGLIGGCHLKDTEIIIKHYEPCRNIAASTIHCDMCPVSQAEAVENIHRLNMEVLGWFHSHPTFDPEPSQQDLNTQLDLEQCLDNKCLGFILSPFCSMKSSPFRCIIVDRHQPFQLQIQINATDFNHSEFNQNLQKILRITDSTDQIHWFKQYFRDNSLTFLDKFIKSVIFTCNDLDDTTTNTIIKTIVNLNLS